MARSCTKLVTLSLKSSGPSTLRVFQILPPSYRPTPRLLVACYRHEEKDLADGETAASKLDKQVAAKEAERREVSFARRFGCRYRDINLLLRLC